jgi:hypothetical protein
MHDRRDGGGGREGRRLRGVPNRQRGDGGGDEPWHGVHVAGIRLGEGRSERERLRLGEEDGAVLGPHRLPGGLAGLTQDLEPTAGNERQQVARGDDRASATLDLTRDARQQPTDRCRRARRRSCVTLQV